MTDHLTPDQEAILDKVQKLLNLAAKNSNEAESTAAAAKAQELLLKHNLSTAALEKTSGGSGKRMQEEVEGGFYRYQREVWEQVARLNFCRHWVQKKWVAPEERVRGTRFKRRHVLIGRQVNVRTTINMAGYLLAAIERITREVCAEKRIENTVGNWAMSFREGMAHRITEKLWERRQDLIAAEEKRMREAQARAAAAGVSSSTELTISSLAQSEADANRDFVRGVEEGTTARERAKDAAEARKREEEYTRWAAANPEAAKAKAEQKEKEAEAWLKKHRSRGGSRDTRYDHVDYQAFNAGRKKGDEIGLDPQTSQTNKNARRIT